MSKLTENFDSKEFECPCKNCNGGRMNGAFMQRLQRLRSNLGRPLRINSGYRCLSHNNAIKGSEKSMHLLGRAVDIDAVSGNEKHSIVMAAMALGFKGIGVGKTFIHIDDREIPAMWVY